MNNFLIPDNDNTQIQQIIQNSKIQKSSNSITTNTTSTSTSASASELLQSTTPSSFSTGKTSPFSRALNHKNSNSNNKFNDILNSKEHRDQINSRLSTSISSTSSALSTLASATAAEITGLISPSADLFSDPNLLTTGFNSLFNTTPQQSTYMVDNNSPDQYRNYKQFANNNNYIDDQQHRQQQQRQHQHQHQHHHQQQQQQRYQSNSSQIHYDTNHQNHQRHNQHLSLDTYAQHKYSYNLPPSSYDQHPLNTNSHQNHHHLNTVQNATNIPDSYQYSQSEHPINNDPFHSISNDTAIPNILQDTQVIPTNFSNTMINNTNNSTSFPVALPQDPVQIPYQNSNTDYFEYPLKAPYSQTHPKANFTPQHLQQTKLYTNPTFQPPGTLNISHKQTTHELSKSSVPWTYKESKQLMRLREKGLTWKQISQSFKNRTLNACQFKWKRIMMSGGIELSEDEEEKEEEKEEGIEEGIEEEKENKKIVSSVPVSAKSDSSSVGMKRSSESEIDDIEFKRSKMDVSLFQNLKFAKKNNIPNTVFASESSFSSAHTELETVKNPDNDDFIKDHTEDHVDGHVDGNTEGHVDALYFDFPDI